MDQKITYGLIGIIAMLAGFGGSMILDQDTIDHTYVCNVTEQIGTFTRLSSTMKTGYYSDPINASIERSKVCTNGQWIKLSTYAESKGIDPITFLMQASTSIKDIRAPEEECFLEDQNIGCIKIN